jgi:hypothetical protein
MPILLAGTIEFVHIDQVSALFTFCFGHVLLYMLLSRHQNAGQIQDIKIANRSYENVSQFRYLGTTVTNQNLIQEEIEFW